MKFHTRAAVALSFLALVFSAAAQTSPANSGASSVSAQVPRLIRFSGVAKDETGKPVPGVLGITFALYRDEQGGAPLWIETQNVQADAAGHYTVLLGSATQDGVPLSLFSSAEVHWIGTQISGHSEQTRVLLLSVPYALKAADAETLGGMPASSFVQVNPAEAIGSSGKTMTPASSSSTKNALTPALTGTGTTDYIPLWTTSTNLGNSTLFETGGNVGVNTKTPGAKLDTVGTVIAVRGTTSGATGTGVFGQATSTTGVNFGVQGKSASTAAGSAGVSGTASAATGQVDGVYGSTSSTSQGAAGVKGFAGGATGVVSGVGGSTNSASNFAAGVSGLENATTGQNFGVQGAAFSTTNGAAGVIGSEEATTGVVYGVSGGTSSTTSGAAAVNGYEGAATGQVFGVSGGTNSATNFAAGVSGSANATTGQVYGVVGVSHSATNGAAGVIGSDSATTGQVYGVFGYTNSATTAATGVVGNANATTGQVTGVSGNSASTSGTGVFGSATATTGATFGVFGQTASPSGHGTSGYASATSGPAIGVVGLTNSPAGAGASFTNLGGGTSAVIIASGAGYANVFTLDASGNLSIKGKLTKGSGSFKIDHPLDPANKYLSHSFIESPDMMNVYNGNITTDKHGLATVVLPNYFEALNRDFRYQLTVIGQFAQAIVKQEIQNNRFTIRTSRPLVKVSWQVTGIRHDAYADAYRIPVEEEKPRQEQGHFLHPELFGASQQQAIGAGLPTPSTADSPTRASLVSPLSEADAPVK